MKLIDAQLIQKRSNNYKKLQNKREKDTWHKIITKRCIAILSSKTRYYFINYYSCKT